LGQYFCAVESKMNTANEISNLSKQHFDEKTKLFESTRLIEALLFASPSPLKRTLLQARIPATISIGDVLEELRKTYSGRGINLQNIGDAVAFRTASDLIDDLRLSVAVKRRLSAAAVETMSIIAYHQPVTRGDIESIRGVAVSKGTLDTLLEAGWIKPRGRRKVPGRPLQWGTTDGFLDHFGIEHLQDLPGLEELKAAGLLEKRQSLTSLILPDDLLNEEEEVEEDEDDQNELFTTSDDVLS
jgi:segregation and condensation protein B